MLTTLLDARLYAQGDTYSLYDLQTQLHNLVWMAQRCSRGERISELANFLAPVFERLESLNDAEKSFAWVCRGGSVCNEHNRLINREVPLVSLQGLGLLTTVAAALAQQTPRSAEQHPFVRRTTEVAAAHLLRLQTPSLLDLWDRNRRLSAHDVTPNTRSPEFADHWMWMLVIQSNLAVIREHAGPAFLPETSVRPLAEAYRRLVALFRARLNIDPATGAADFDRGFWRYNPSNRFASYRSPEPPTRCLPGREVPEMLVNADDLPVPANVGWDISHSRRLVHVALAAEQARSALTSQFGLSSADQLPADLGTALAKQVLVKVWNQDLAAPLFANYWSGDNGWYRVAYVNQTGRCYPGTPPYGLSSSVPLGGFLALTGNLEARKELTNSLRVLFQQKDEPTKRLVTNFYPLLSVSSNAQIRDLAELNFYSSIIIR